MRPEEPAAAAAPVACEDDQAFPYRQLETLDIRYVSLEPFDEDVGLVECSIWQTSLEEAEYTAISYAWGDAQDTEPILVAGHRFEVTRNLAACLKSLAIKLAAKVAPAENRKPMNLWVDAICINQDDVVERNAQVLRMKDIFPNAAKLIVWLGTAGAHTDLAVDRIKDLAHRLDELIETGRRNNSRHMRGAREKVPEHIYAKTTDEREVAVRSAVMDIYTRSWWERTWILQELGLSADVEVHCGDYKMTWEELEGFQKFAGYLMMDKPELLFQSPEDEGVQMIDIQKLPLAALNLKDDIGDGYCDSLHLLLDSTKSNKATDLRDKIYGILGLSSDFRSGGITPQYEKPVLQVYLDVVRAYFERNDSLDILDQCHHAHTAAIGLPSWIPNWALAETEDLADIIPKFLIREDHEPQQAFSACGGLALSSRPWSFGRDGRTLHLAGAVFDTITSVTETADFFHNCTIESLLEAWLSTLPRPHGHPYPFAPRETWLDAFRKTVVFDIKFLPAERGFAMVFPADEDSAEASFFMDRLSEARPQFYKACMLRRLAYSSRGMVVLVRPEVRVGDGIAVLAGSTVPQCLREVSPASSSTAADPGGGAPRYELLGEAYFHGVMDGEAMAGLQLDEIVLV